MLSNLLATSILDLPMQGPPPLPAPPDTPAATAGGVRPAEIPGVFAAIIGTVLLIYILKFVDRILPFYVRIDDYVRAFLIFFGIIGPLSLFPILNSVSGLVTDIFSAGLANSGWQLPAIIGASIVNIVLVVLAVYSIYKDDAYSDPDKGWRAISKTKLIFAFLVTATFFGLPWMNFLLVWTINNISVNVWNFFMGIFNFLADRRLSLS